MPLVTSTTASSHAALIKPNQTSEVTVSAGKQSTEEGNDTSTNPTTDEIPEDGILIKKIVIEVIAPAEYIIPETHIEEQANVGDKNGSLDYDSVGKEEPTDKPSL